MQRSFCLDARGHPRFDTLHSRCADHLAVACAFDLLALDGDDLWRRPYTERKAALRKLLRHSREGVQYVEHTEGDGDAMFDAICKLGLEAVSKGITAPYRSGPSRAWIKMKKPRAPAVGC